MKPIHGTPQPKNVPHDMVATPPIDQCPFRVGDLVTYTNYYGVRFEARVRGFKSRLHAYDRSYTELPSGRQKTERIVSPRFIYLEFLRGGEWRTEGTAWWFAHSPSELTKKSA